MVHPWYSQGNCELLSYQLPQTWTNVANAWEMTMVQDYVTGNGLAPRQGDLPMGSALPGEPHQPACRKRNPGRPRCPGARRDCMCGLCVTDMTAGHCAGVAAEQGTVRPGTMAKCRKHAEMTCSLTFSQVRGNSKQYRLASDRRHLPLQPLTQEGRRPARGG